ncbi:ribose-5-phosphate isomerase RpiA [Treponema putidum]|uniref:Ribose-5-phosphate isomerase A n=1 Tax=Treponema putidum TaxID=221027 RepID=A0ABY5HVR0_9SPIR|nr:ribose-5-phosphate isomerase RpiA [Treponema putidum]AIN94641.1 ribose 5-phosphate isomerase [Treponema putidum]TWI78754.1 ribose-5-phosphate isomerase [Treponema putidum]UTY28664.1 ribose-5-phosphate isomerase RpiA [Treponema putidum]UTY31099.1 ribose-5-phosphate isomerase RpiA [Treponema putidum]
MDISELKKKVAYHAIDTLFSEGKIFDGIKIGLGTGSTALPAVNRIAQLLSSKKISTIFAVPTSFQTSIECEKLGIPVYSLSSKKIGGSLDLAIDGADEIDPDKNLIKGGGAALLREKIIAYNSKEFVVIADERKKVKSIGKGFALPIEIIPEARLSITKILEAQGIEVVLREGVKKMGPVVTDNGNFIIDVRWPKEAGVDPKVLEESLNKITGIVENGFFTKNTPRVFIVHQDGKIEDL